MRHPELTELEALEPKLAPNLADGRLVSSVGLSYVTMAKWSVLSVRGEGGGGGSVEVVLMVSLDGPNVHVCLDVCTVLQSTFNIV